MPSLKQTVETLALIAEQHLARCLKKSKKSELLPCHVGFLLLAVIGLTPSKNEYIPRDRCLPEVVNKHLAELLLIS